MSRISMRELLLLSLSTACTARSSPLVHTTTTGVQAKAESATHAPADNRANPDNAAANSLAERIDPYTFLVYGDAGKIELRSAKGAPTRELAESTSEPIYDPALELIWFVSKEQLSVIDLRTRNPRPIEIARGVPDVSVLSISGRNSSVTTDESCQGPSFRLLWNERLSFEAYDRDTSDTQITGSSWLQQNLGRPAREVGARRNFTDAPHVRLPRKLLDCEELNECATTAKFGPDGLELVLVRDKGGGDCWNRACIVRDPKTNRYASPSDLQTWTPAAKAKPGTCGPFYFDQSQKSYLVGNRLCTLGAPCQKLHGQALGWLQSGDIVGDVGGADLQDSDDDE